MLYRDNSFCLFLLVFALIDKNLPYTVKSAACKNAYEQLSLLKISHMPITFYLDKRLNKHGESPIRVVWCFNGDRYQTTLGYTVKPTAWSDSLKRVIDADNSYKETDAYSINVYIDSLKKAVNRMENEAHLLHATLTKPLVKRVIEDIMSAGGKYPSLKEYVWMQMLKERRQSTDRYFEHFRGGKYKLICFAKDTDTLKNVVVYQALYGANEILVRPYDVFFGTIKMPDGSMVKRFREISF